MLTLLLPLPAQAQVNSGSNGSDGAFNPTTNTVINMADHPTGIYQYTSVNISNGVTVTFIPNANNTPVVWLVQSNCVINGTVDVSGETVAWDTVQAGRGGPGGYQGGNGQAGAIPSGIGSGPGGGGLGGGGSFGTAVSGSSNIYGNNFLLPLIGGSGGGGSISSCYYGNYGEAGGGGGGALLIAASGTITLNGWVAANGGGAGNRRCDYPSYDYCCAGGGGSGGAIRLVASRISGTGGAGASGGNGGCCGATGGGLGRVRFDAFANELNGGIVGVFTQGYQPIIIPTAGQGAQLTVTSVGGVPVSASPTGALSTPDAVLAAQQNNPIPIVVHCSNIPLNTQITVSVKPANGAAVSATGYNNTGTLSSSTATISINIPRGGGLVYATAAN